MDLHRALFISYWVPPRKGIGSVRCAHLLKHLAEFGWDVTTLTAEFPDGSHATAVPSVETRYWSPKSAVKKLMGMGNRSAHEALNVHVPQHGAKKSVPQRLISAVGVPLTYPDEHAGWLPFATHAARNLIAHGGFDVVLTSGPPVTTNLIAALSRGRVPWVADMRDLWAENDSEDRGAFRMFLDDKLERLCLSKAAALVATSDLSAKRFERRYPRVPVFSISTGFDGDEWEHIPFAQEMQCTLFYAGTLYAGKRDPSTLFCALRSIFDEGTAQPADLRVDLYTPREPWLLDLVSRFGLERVVRVHGMVDRNTVLAAERRADRLIVLSWDGATAHGVVPGKLFEYFGARRRVFAIGGPSESSVGALLRETGAGIQVRTIDEIKREVLGALSEHHAGIVRVVPANAVSAYSGRDCARRFADVLNQTLCSAGTLDRRARASNATTAMPAKTAK